MIQAQVLNYCADTIVGLIQDYDQTVIDQQLAVQEEFGARPDLKPLARVAERCTQHAAFRQQKTITREAWLTQCKTLTAAAAVPSCGDGTARLRLCASVGGPPAFSACATMSKPNRRSPRGGADVQAGAGL
jgi:hypothetical protein